MVIKKVMRNKGAYEIEYFDSNLQTRVLKSSEEAIPEFKESLEIIVKVVKQSLGLGEENHVVAVAVERVSVGKVDGYQFTGCLIDGYVDNKLKTDKFPMSGFPYMEETETVFSLAERFVNGERNQQELPIDPDYEEEEEIPVDDAESGVEE